MSRTLEGRDITTRLVVAREASDAAARVGASRGPLCAALF
jgi:hypothetical protein